MSSDDKPARSNPVARAFGHREIMQAYPGEDEAEIELLLDETWNRRLCFEAYTQFKEAAYEGRFVNVDPAGFRRIPGQAAWPPSPHRKSVFLFGGSTTFGYGVRDGETLAAGLQALLPDTTVFNFGRCYYQSTQERILAEQLLLDGRRPSVAVFLDGLNDFYFADGSPHLADEIADFMSGKQTRRSSHILSERRRDAVSPTQEALATKDAGGAPDPALLERTCRRYLANRGLAEAALRAHGASSLFVWQPVPTYKYDLAHHPFAYMGFARHSLSKEGYGVMADIVAREPQPPSFLWLADLQEDLHESLYVDRVHYNAKLTLLLAERIAAAVVERGLV